MIARYGLASALLLAAAVAVVPPVTAQPARTAMPQAVGKEIGEIESFCRRDGGKLILDTGFQTRADLNGDGRLDFIFDREKVRCRHRAFRGPSDRTGFMTDGAGWCGSGGCVLTIIASSRQGYRAVFHANVRAWKLDRTRRIPTFKFAFHGNMCGRTGSSGCYENWGWNGRRFDELPCRSALTGPHLVASLRNPNCPSWL